MNIEEIKQGIHNAFNDYKLDMCKNEAHYVFEEANNIAKMSAIHDFLLCAPEELTHLTKLAEKVDETEILNNLFEYEFEYDEPMWGNWEDLKELVESFLVEPADENEEDD